LAFWQGRSARETCRGEAGRARRPDCRRGIGACDDEPVSRSYDAVLFDFGGVLTSSPFAALRAKGEESGAGYDTVRNLVMGPYDEDTDHAWHRAERGELALADALELITTEAQTVGLAFDPSKIGSFFGPASVQDVVVERIRRLRSEDYRTALVTNNVRELAPFWRPLVPLDELFDVVIDSSEVGVRKPDPRIFMLTLARLGVPAERSVFLDDWPGHLVAAEALGLRGILVGSDPAEAMAELDALLSSGAA
jgi:putative hydrolase of the HAD superfamily